MALKKLVSLGKLASLPKGRAKLVVLPDGTRFACVRRAGAGDEPEQVDVLEDRCPHEGHPLSMGLVRDGVLTCQWHNWKFDLGTGACTAGGEAVRRYPAEVYADEVFVDLDRTHDPARSAEDLARALREGAIDAAVRVALRWSRLEPGAPLEAMVLQVARARPRGLGDAMAAMAAIRAFGPIFSEAESFALIAQVAAQEVHGRVDRSWPPTVLSGIDDAESFLADLLEERRADAIGRVLGLAPDVPADAIVARWLLPWTAAKLWDRGDALARVAGVIELLPSLSPKTARVLVASLAESIAWSVADSDLPPWRATRNALLAASTITPGSASAHVSLPGREPEAVTAAVAALQAGVAPQHVLEAIERGSLLRLARYDLRCSQKVGSTAHALDAGQPMLLARAAGSLLSAGLASPAQAVSWCVQGAGLLGRLASRDGHEHVAEGDDLDALVRRGLLEGPLDETLARRVTVARAVYAHRGRAAMERLFADRVSLARLAANAARHVDVGEPPVEGDGSA